MNDYITNNAHFLKRARNIRNELLNKTDKYFLIDFPGRMTFFSKLFQTQVFGKMSLEKCHLEKLFFQKVIIHIWRSSEKIVTCTPWSRYISDVFTPWSR